MVTYTSISKQINNSEDVNVLKVQSLVMDVIHYIDIIDQLSSAKVRSVDDWIWQKQLRLVFDNNCRSVLLNNLYQISLGFILKMAMR